MHELEGHTERTLDPGLAARSQDNHDAAANLRASRGTLLRIVETEILPRLLLAYSGCEREPREAPTEGVDGAQGAGLGAMLLGDNATAASGYIDSLRRRGVPTEALLTDLLAPAARRLGELWEADACDFVQVTVGLGRLQALARGLMNEFDLASRDDAHAPSALFAAAPGETHLFGVEIVEGFFRADGWRAERAPSEEVEKRLSRRWFDIVGFSISCDRYAVGLRRAVAAARRAARNRAIRVFVGGPVVDRSPELLIEVGADAVASDALSAVQVARSLLERRKAV